MAGRNEKRDDVYTRAKIKLGYACPYDCAFCECKKRRELPAPSKRALAEKVQLAARLGRKQALFSGGEPLLCPHLPVLMALAKRLGMTSGLITSGTGLDDPARVETLRRAGLSFVQLSLHGASENTHDAIMGRGAFGRAMNALENLAKAGVGLRVNTVLTRKNLHEIEALAESLFAFSPLVHELSFLNPERLSETEFETYVPTIAEAALAVRRTILHVENHPERPKDFRIVFTGFPLCALPRQNDWNGDLDATDRAEISETTDRAFRRPEFLGRVKPEVCETCGYIEDCEGVYESYLSRRKTDELHPFRSPVANGFCYLPEKTLPDFDPADCPILGDRMEAPHPDRTLLLLRESGVEIVRTETRDFTDEALRRVKRSRGQIYLDLSGKRYHEDFQADLGKLEPIDICTKCKRFPQCPGVYAQSPGDPFGAAEEELLTLIEGFRGRVLDVGGGPVRYAREFGRRIEAGRMDYFVVEPTPAEALLDFLRRYDLENRLFRGCVEDFVWEGPPFDWILVLRSHNHLHDIPLAYANMASRLNPQGRLLVVDNSAFGLVRRRETFEATRADGGPERFEHFNNHGAEDAVPLVEAAGFRCLESHPVHPKSANQWWALFRKT